MIELLIREHYNNRVGVTFLSKTAHQMYTNDPDGYIPPDMTFGRWWELLSIYKYGITYDIANKVIKYIQKYQNEIVWIGELYRKKTIKNVKNSKW